MIEYFFFILRNGWNLFSHLNKILSIIALGALIINVERAYFDSGSSSLLFYAWLVALLWYVLYTFEHMKNLILLRNMKHMHEGEEE
jgi:hypothetical protein